MFPLQSLAGLKIPFGRAPRSAAVCFRLATIAEQLFFACRRKASEEPLQGFARRDQDSADRRRFEDDSPLALSCPVVESPGMKLAAGLHSCHRVNCRHQGGSRLEGHRCFARQVDHVRCSFVRCLSLRRLSYRNRTSLFRILKNCQAPFTAFHKVGSQVQ